jgi:catechol 2,3-dioxygenase-like lactoylglutathione lyase family enzyme
MPATATAAPTRFHVGLHVSDLGRSVQFYRLLLGVGPAKHFDDYAKFELEEPPLVLALYPSPQTPGGALNHVGLRLPDSAALVEVQRRLEEAGVATQRQEGVECCYARQTKFWVADPDRTLWEVYTLDEDIGHSGFDDPPPPPDAPARAVWEHRLTDPVPGRIPHGDGSLDEVRLEGTFNAAVEPACLAALLGEVRRVLRPGGTVAVHGLVGDRAFPGTPALPGLASLVRRVPVETEPLEALQGAGFTGLHFEKLGDVHCFGVRGVELREMRLLGRKPPGGPAVGAARVLYKGPFAEVVDEDGTVFPRGEVVTVSVPRAARLLEGPLAEQFAFLPK